MKLYSVLVLAVIAMATPASPADSFTQLPATVRPVHYDLAIDPDAAALTFQGSVTIALDVLRPTADITLNALGLSFAAVRLTTGPDRTPQGLPVISVDEASQTATFRYDRPLPVGRYELAIDYAGTIGTQAVGLFAMDYATSAGDRRALYTQLAVAEARRVFPCWDEPGFKTTFALQATVPTGQMAISNMPVSSRSELGNGRARVAFESTPKMSTYLLFFALGDFDRVTTSVDGTELGVVTQAGISSQAAFALQSSARVLREYNEYFGSAYPLPKLDNVASPGSSMFYSAMENWGAIFTFEYAILLDPSIATQADRQDSFETVAHEIAHMWFGNLVTMQWWDDLWLNEGFASWLGGRSTEKLHPEWNTRLTAVNSRERAMSRDALATTHPVVQRVTSVEQAIQAFDAISYLKGEAVLRMLEDYVGSEAWRTGVQRYINAHRYGSTVSGDFWNAIEKASGQPVTAVAHDFTLQPGIPLIRAEEPVCRSGRTHLRLSQSEFSKDQPDRKALAWRVPVIAKPVEGTEVRAMVTRGRSHVRLEGCSPVILNAGQSGYYRTLYSPAHFKAISAVFASVEPIDQLGILLDSWALGRTGQQPVTDFLELTRSVSPQSDPQIWRTIIPVFREIDQLHAGDTSRQLPFRKFALARLRPVFAAVGWSARPDEPATTALLRNDLIETLGTLGDPAVIEEARRRYSEQDVEAAMPAAIRRSTLVVVAEHADNATWEKLRAAAVAEKSALVKDDLFTLLARPRDPALARRALELALTVEPAATTSPQMLAAAAILHPDMAFEFAQTNFDAVSAKVDASSTSSFFAELANRSLDPAMPARISAYAEARLAANARNASDTVIANIEDRLAVRRLRLPAIDAWLATAPLAE